MIMQERDARSRREHFLQTRARERDLTNTASTSDTSSGAEEEETSSSRSYFIKPGTRLFVTDPLCTVFILVNSVIEPAPPLLGIGEKGENFTEKGGKRE
jgi:hypothetical protein